MVILDNFYDILKCNIFLDDLFINSTANNSLRDKLGEIRLLNLFFWDWFFSNYSNIICLFVCDCDNNFAFSFRCLYYHSWLDIIDCLFGDNRCDWATDRNHLCLRQLIQNVLSHRWLLNNLNIVGWLNFSSSNRINTKIGFTRSLRN